MHRLVLWLGLGICRVMGCGTVRLGTGVATRTVRV